MSDNPWVTIAPAGLALATAIIGLWGRKLMTGEQKIQRTQTAAERKEAALAVEQTRLDIAHDAFLKMVEQQRDRALLEADNERRRRIEVEIDRDRGWNLARFYHRYTRDAHHMVRNLQQIVMGLCTRAGEAPPTWPPLPDVPVQIEDTVLKDRT